MSGHKFIRGSGEIVIIILVLKTDEQGAIQVKPALTLVWVSKPHSSFICNPIENGVKVQYHFEPGCFIKVFLVPNNLTEKQWALLHSPWCGDNSTKNIIKTSPVIDHIHLWHFGDSAPAAGPGHWTETAGACWESKRKPSSSSWNIFQSGEFEREAKPGKFSGYWKHSSLSSLSSHDLLSLRQTYNFPVCSSSVSAAPDYIITAVETEALCARGITKLALKVIDTKTSPLSWSELDRSMLCGWRDAGYYVRRRQERARWRWWNCEPWSCSENLGIWTETRGGTQHCGQGVRILRDIQIIDCRKFKQEANLLIFEWHPRAFRCFSFTLCWFFHLLFYIHCEKELIEFPESFIKSSHSPELPSAK